MNDGAEPSETALWGDAAGTEVLRRYRTLVDIIDDGVFQLDNEERFAAVNDVLVERTGYERAALLGEPFSILVENAEERAIDDALDRLANNADTAAETLEISVETAAGEPRHWELKLTAIAEDGTSEGVLGIARDVTGRYHQQREYNRVKEALEANHEGVGLMDEDGVFTYVNEAYAETFGYTPAEMEGTSWEELGIHANPEKIHEEVLPTVATTGTWTDTSTCARKDGRTFLADHSVTQTDHDGFICMVRDVTSQRQQQRELERQSRIIETVDDGVYAVDENSEFVMVNDAFCEMVGWEREELLGQHATMVYDDEIAPAAAEQADEIAAGERDIATMEFTLITSDGERVPVENRFRPFPGDDGDGRCGVIRDISERREREQALRKSELRYRTLVENFPNGAVGLVDQSLRYVAVGGTPLTVGDQSSEELDGRHVKDVLTPELADKVVPRYRAALEGESSTFEYAFDGVDAHARFRFFPVRDDDGEVFAAMGMSQDITEQVTRERELEESERLYRTLAENFPDGAVGVYDEELRYDLVEGAMWERMQTGPGDLAGKRVHDVFSETVVNAVEPVFRDAITDGTTDSVQVEFEGEILRVWATPLRDAGGEIFAGLSFAQVITEQVERERRLEESKNQLQALIDVLPVAVFVAEADGEIIDWNEAAVDLWGGEIVEADSVAQYDEYTGWWADTGDRVQPAEWPLSRALEGEEITEPEVIEIERFDGERRTVLMHGMPVRDADGEITRAVVTHTDITERREYQQKLEESNERLEQFAYAASHDLQEPLRMVSSYLQLIEDRYGERLDEDGQEFIDFAVDGADRMRDMIEGLLDYSRIDTRGDPFELVELEEVFDDVRADIRMRIEESDAEITVEPLPEVVGDRSQLYQLFQNLLVNAIEYSGDQPPKIHVSAKRCGSEWAISVADEGIGIDPDQTERVFEIFQSLHPSEHGDGTGIGLALADRIVERHGGDIRAESEPGEGTTFTFTLPVGGAEDV